MPLAFSAPSPGRRLVSARFSRWLAAMVCGLALGACGGGGGGEAPPPAPAAEQARLNVGGTLAGLGAGKTVVLAHVDATGATVQSASLSANGRYSLSLPSGTAYNLRVIVQPVAQTCTVANGMGIVSAEVTNITVSCLDDAVPPTARVISGTVAGLAAGRAVVLQLSAGGVTQETTANADGSFSFPQPITGPYVITVRTPPTGQGCTVANGQGQISDAMPALTVTCAATTFRLGGSVTGNLGTVVLRNTVNGEMLTINGSGAFSFAQPVIAGGSYAITVADQSANQSCAVAGGSGTASADVTSIAVSCSAAAVALPPPPPMPVPVVPASLTMTYGIKSFNIAWSASATATSYQLFEDADGAGPAASIRIGGAIAGTTYTHVVSGLLHTRLNALYSAQACNAAGCSTATAAITPNLTQAIGYFKASNTGALDLFGYSVALSADGSTLAVGAYLEDSNATGTYVTTPGDGVAANGSGAVYVFVRSGGAWTMQAYVKATNTGARDSFGWSVALSGDGSTLAVGAEREGSAATGTHVVTPGDGVGAEGSGAVYVYTRSGGDWAFQAYLKATNTDLNDVFGQSLALSTDGSTLAVGASNEDSATTGTHAVTPANGVSARSSGAVYVYTRNGSAWTFQAYVKASNTGTQDRFGFSVALSADGSTLAVSAVGESSAATGTHVVTPGDGAGATDSGAVYVYTRSGGAWALQAYVKASNTGPLHRFGESVALSADGNTLAVGSMLEASAATGTYVTTPVSAVATQSGAVYVYTRTGGAWALEAYVKASNTGQADLLGRSVALSADGNTLAAGSFFEDSAAIGLHAVTPGDGFGGDNSGAVYVYTRNAGVWTFKAYVKASNTGAGDGFSYSVALSADGSTLAVGATGEDSGARGINGTQANDASGDQSGAVYIY